MQPSGWWVQNETAFPNTTSCLWFCQSYVPKDQCLFTLHGNSEHVLWPQNVKTAMLLCVVQLTCYISTCVLWLTLLYQHTSYNQIEDACKNNVCKKLCTNFNQQYIISYAKYLKQSLILYQQKNNVQLFQSQSRSTVCFELN